MTEIIHARHPVPVRYVPARARTVYTTFLGVTTPVTLREGEGWTGLARIRDTHFFEHEGRIWIRLNGHDAQWGDTTLDRSEFLSFLKGERARVVLPAQTLHALRRSPLCAETDLGGSVCSPLMEDASEELGKARRIVEDGTEHARGALQRYLDDNVRLFRDQVFVRACPLAAHPGERPSPQFQLLPHPRSLRGIGLMTRIDRLDEFWEFEKSVHGPDVIDESARRTKPMFGGLENTFPAALMEDDDVRLLANALPGMVLDALDMTLRIQASGSLPDQVARGVESLRTWKGRGGIGAVGLDEAEAVLLLCRDVFAAADAELGVPAYDAERVRVPLAYAERIALPRLRAADAALDADDVAAFSGVMP